MVYYVWFLVIFYTRRLNKYISWLKFRSWGGMDLQAEPVHWTQVWFAACCCWDVIGSGNCPQEVEGLERQSGMLGRAAPVVTLSCGRGTRAGKQKDRHQKLHFFLQCRAHLLSLPWGTRDWSNMVAAARSFALCLWFLSRCLLSSAVRVRCGRTLGSFAVSLISPCSLIWEERAPYWPPLTHLWVYLGSD